MARSTRSARRITPSRTRAGSGHELLGGTRRERRRPHWLRIHAVILARRAGYYKPDPRPYNMPLAEPRVAASCCLFVTGSAYDLFGTRKPGLATFWRNRIGMPRLAGVPSRLCSTARFIRYCRWRESRTEPRGGTVGCFGLDWPCHGENSRTRRRPEKRASRGTKQSPPDPHTGTRIASLPSEYRLEWYDLLRDTGGLPGHHLPLSAPVGVNVSETNAKTVGSPLRHDADAA